jgi:hypothetical protein
VWGGRRRRRNKHRGVGRRRRKSEWSQNTPWGVALWPLLAWRQSQAQRIHSLCKWKLENKYFSCFSFKILILQLLLYTFKLLVLKSVFLSFPGNFILWHFPEFPEEGEGECLRTKKKVLILHPHSSEILQIIQPGPGLFLKLVWNQEDWAPETQPLHCLLEVCVEVLPMQDKQVFGISEALPPVKSFKFFPSPRHPEQQFLAFLSLISFLWPPSLHM